MNQGALKLLPLTGLRFIAAGMIVLLHAFEYNYHLPQALHAIPLTQAVSFFFILSGFILSHVYTGFDEKGSRTRFLLARFARLWPAHLFTAILAVIIVPRRLTNAAHDAPLLMVPLAQALMLQSWIPVKAYYASFNSVAWSISTEFFFYLCFPFLQNQSMRKLSGYFLGVIGITFCIIALGTLAHLPLDGEKHAFSLMGLLYIWPVCRMMEFLAGMLTYRLFKRFESGSQPQDASKSKATLFEAGGLFLLLGAMLMSHSPILNALTQNNQALSVFLTHYGFTLPAFSLFIYLMAKGHGLIASVLSNRGLVFLGEISYSMYLLHKVLFWHFKGQEPPFWIYCALLLMGSYLVWQWVEKPLRKLIITQGTALLVQPRLHGEPSPALRTASPAEG
jgi:peptidoglycan/LPS O-acetylase OafA/YrhL